MTDLSNFIDIEEDDDDFIPDSLASFIRDANKTLDAATMNFMDTDSVATSRNQDMSMDTASTPILFEDDEDKRLKQQVMNKLHSNKSLIMPRNLAAEDPSTPPSQKSVFHQAFATPPHQEEEICLISTAAENAPMLKEEELIPRLAEAANHQFPQSNRWDTEVEDDVPSSLEQSLVTIGEKLFADGKKAAAVERTLDVPNKTLLGVQKTKTSSSAFDSDEDDIPLDEQFAAMESELFVGGRLKKDALTDGMKTTHQKHAPPPATFVPPTPPRPIRKPPAPAPQPPPTQKGSFFGSLLSSFGVPASPEPATPSKILEDSRHKLALRQLERNKMNPLTKTTPAKVPTARQVAAAPEVSSSPRTPIISPLPVASTPTTARSRVDPPDDEKSKAPLSRTSTSLQTPHGSLVHMPTQSKPSDPSVASAAAVFLPEHSLSAKKRQSPKATSPLFPDRAVKYASISSPSPRHSSSVTKRNNPEVNSPPHVSRNSSAISKVQTVKSPNKSLLLPETRVQLSSKQSEFSRTTSPDIRCSSEKVESQLPVTLATTEPPPDAKPYIVHVAKEEVNPKFSTLLPDPQSIVPSTGRASPSAVQASPSVELPGAQSSTFTALSHVRGEGSKMDSLRTQPKDLFSMETLTPFTVTASDLKPDHATCSVNGFESRASAMIATDNGEVKSEELFPPVPQSSSPQPISEGVAADSTESVKEMTPARKIANETIAEARLDASAFLPSSVDDQGVGAFLPNRESVIEEKKTRLQPIKTTNRSKTLEATPRTVPTKRSSVAKAPSSETTKPSPPLVPRPPLTKVTAPRSNSARDSHESVENQRNAPKPPSKMQPASEGAPDAMAKARDRVRQVRLMEQKRKERLLLSEAMKPAPRVSRGPRIRTVPLHVAQEKTLGRLREQQKEAEAKMKAEEERRQKLAEKVRSYGDGITIPKAPRLSVATRRPPPPPTPPSKPAAWVKPKLTNPKPFKFQGKAPPPSPPPRDDTSVISMAESMENFMRKGLRDSAPFPKTTGKPKLTTPKPFRFHESKSNSATPGTTMEARKKKAVPTFAEGLQNFDKHLRESEPLRQLKGDELKPTIPKAPNFTPIHHRERPKSTAEKEAEIMEYYETHKFKARGIMTHQVRPTLSVSQRKLTVPKPFKLSLEARAAHDDHKPEEAKVNMFHARPMPNFGGSAGGEIKRRPLYVSGVEKFCAEEKPMSPKEKEDLEEIKKKFHAREMPDFSAGSKLTSPPPKSFLSRFRSNPLKAPDPMVPSTIEVRGMLSFGGPRVAPCPGSPRRPLTTPKPFRLSSPNVKSREILSPDEVEIKKKFKARYLPMSTFVLPSSITSPAKSIPSSIRTSNPPKLFTETRCEQREAAVLASRINAELVSRERATVRQRKQAEQHQIALDKSKQPSPVKLKAETMAPFHLASDRRHEAYQKKLQERLDQEERDRKAMAEVKAMPMPNFQLMSPRSKPPQRADENQESEDLELGLPRHVAHGEANSAISDLLSLPDSNGSFDA